MADIEADAQMGAIDLVDEFEEIPNTGADVIAPRVILHAALHAELFVQRGEFAERSFQRGQLGWNRLCQVVMKGGGPITLHSEPRGSAENSFIHWSDAADIGRDQGKIE